MNQFGEIQIPEIEEKKRFGRRPRRNRKPAAGILAGVLLLAAAAAFAFVRLYDTDERVILKAFRNLAEEALERRELWETAAGNGQGNGTPGNGQSENGQSENVPSGDRTGQNQPDRWFDRISLETVCNLSGEGLPFTLGVDTVLARDAEARKMKACTKFSVSNTKLAELEFYGGDDELIVRLPDFSEKNFTFDGERIDVQYNGSLFAKIFGTLQNREISINLFPERTPVPWIRYLEGWQEKVGIEKLENAVNISVPERDDRQYRCSQYRLTISADWMNALIMDCMEASGNPLAEEGITAEITGDIAIILAIEEKNDRLVRISLEEPFGFSVGNAEHRTVFETSGEICFLGEARSIDDILVSMKTEMPLSALGLDERLLAVFGNRAGTEDVIEADLSAEVLYDENDTSVTADLHRLTVSVDRIGNFKLTGKAKIEPLREEIEEPSGERIRLFEITEEAYADLRDQIMKKVWRWMKALSVFG